VTTFQARVYAQEYLPAGTAEVHALVAVRAVGAGAPGAALDAAEVILVDCSGSMGAPLTKIDAARRATAAAIDRLRDGTRFAIVAGNETARLVYPDVLTRMAVVSETTRAGAKARVRDLEAGGGTAISTWLHLARRMFGGRPDALHHAILLTDGRNESEPADRLGAELEACRGAFVCDCRGVGADWDRAELERIAHVLLGDADIVPRPAEMVAEFERIIERAMGRRAAAVQVVVETPGTASVAIFAQSFPQIQDLSDRVTWRRLDERGEWRPVDRDDPEQPMESAYPTGAWSGDEQREYHLCVGVVPQEPGDPHGLRAAVVRLVVDGEEVAEIPVQVRWTHDLRLATRMDPRLTRYLELTDMVRDIRDGFAAMDAGDRERATSLLLRAHEIAVSTGNPTTATLLDRVIDVRSGELRPEIAHVDRLTTEIRSTRVTGSLDEGPPA
jgi:hypothetical protein